VTPSNTKPSREGEENPSQSTLDRRRFLTYVVAAPALVVAARIGLDASTPTAAGAAIPTLPAIADVMDTGDLLIAAGLPTAYLITIEVTPHGTVHFSMPRAEVGQGVTTAIAMLIADEMDVTLDRVSVTLSDARPELLFNQFTGGSNTIRSLYTPVRHVAAAARARLIAAAANQWGVPVGGLSTNAGVVSGPGGKTATYGSLSVMAASSVLASITATPTPESQFALVGTPTASTREIL
jgi:isoquinoline 1-oxidoreductase beta subunit